MDGRVIQQKPLRNSAQGFTVVEMLLGLAIGFIGITIFSYGLIATGKSVWGVKTTITRNALTTLLRNSITDRSSLRKTIEQNPLLFAVIHNDYALIPGGTLQSNHEYDVALFDASGTRIAGTKLAPVYYTIDGIPCTDFGSGSCLVSVTSSFLFQGLPQNNSPERMIPIQQYPVKPGINVDFIQINYKNSFSKSNQGLVRKDVNGSVFINFEDIEL